MNWNRHSTLFFIHLVRDRPHIWNDKLQTSKNQGKRMKAIEEVSKLMGISAKDVRGKWMSLRGQFAREKRRATLVWKDGGGDVQPKWFAYKEMEALVEDQNPLEESYSKDLQESIDLNPAPLEPVVTPKVTSLSTEPTVPIITSVKTQPNDPPIEINPIREVKKEHPEDAMEILDDDELTIEYNDDLLVKEDKKEDLEDNTDIAAFALFVAAQLQKFEPILQSRAKYEINKILFKIEMESLEQKNSEV